MMVAASSPDQAGTQDPATRTAQDATHRATSSRAGRRVRSGRGTATVVIMSAADGSRGHVPPGWCDRPLLTSSGEQPAAAMRSTTYVVDGIGVRGQPHEQVVAQQVALGEAQPGVVQRLEDSVGVVAGLSGHADQREARDDGVLDPLDVELVVRVVGFDERRFEEAVRRPDGVGAAGRGRRVDARAVGRPGRPASAAA